MSLCYTFDPWNAHGSWNKICFMLLLLLKFCTGLTYSRWTRIHRIILGGFLSIAWVAWQVDMHASYLKLAKRIKRIWIHNFLMVPVWYGIFLVLERYDMVCIDFGTWMLWYVMHWYCGPWFLILLLFQRWSCLCWVTVLGFYFSFIFLFFRCGTENSLGTKHGSLGIYCI